MATLDRVKLLTVTVRGRGWTRWVRRPRGRVYGGVSNSHTSQAGLWLGQPIFLDRELGQSNVTDVFLVTVWRGDYGHAWYLQTHLWLVMLLPLLQLVVRTKLWKIIHRCGGVWVMIMMTITADVLLDHFTKITALHMHPVGLIPTLLFCLSEEDTIRDVRKLSVNARRPAV